MISYMLDSQTNVLLMETTCCLHVGVPLTDTAAGNQQKNPSSSLFSFFFFQKSESIMLTQKTHKKRSQKAKAPLTGRKVLPSRRSELAYPSYPVGPAFHTV